MKLCLVCITRNTLAQLLKYFTLAKAYNVSFPWEIHNLPTKIEPAGIQERSQSEASAKHIGRYYMRAINLEKVLQVISEIWALNWICWFRKKFKLEWRYVIGGKAFTTLSGWHSCGVLFLLVEEGRQYLWFKDSLGLQLGSYCFKLQQFIWYPSNTYFTALKSSQEIGTRCKNLLQKKSTQISSKPWEWVMYLTCYMYNWSWLPVEDMATHLHQRMREISTKCKHHYDVIWYPEKLLVIIVRQLLTAV